MKKYQFSIEELIVLRDALADLAHHLKPPENASDNRVKNYRMCRAILEQVNTDIRLHNFDS